MRRALSAIVAAAVLAGAGASSAQTPPAPAAGTTVGEVTVQGQRSAKPPPGFQAKVTRYVHALGRPSAIGNLSRWLVPVCAEAEGLTPAFDAFVARRIEEIAARVGAPKGGRCLQANVRVVFTTQPQKLMDSIRDRRPDLLGFHFAPEERALATFHGPMQAWHVTGTRMRNGATRLDDPYLDFEHPEYGFKTGRGETRFKNGLQSEFMFALVVIDSKVLEGQPIGAVADHAALLALSNPEPRKGCSPLPSLMDAMDPACPEAASLETLTAYDESYLKALYATDPERILAGQRASIWKDMVDSAKPPK